eukprot:gnl/TRDRNA2_/TRDRNA2_171493_c0_seq2.p1 gnl/TRDRNA2_/TRDRNA2_171493_c0~~gnl/TRDRNA2_/TRDRNA2_171493_c0_seq2.p1  ORF type:complete len:445 (+),score=73.23 gnl/TRDRNA2_/TRDRNA2_171493_c0_seq2:155-1336(+)
MLGEVLAIDLNLLRSFAWHLAALLLAGRCLLVVLSDIGARVAAKLSSQLAGFFVSPGDRKKEGNLRRLSARIIIDRAMQPGGTWDVDHQLLEMLLNEAHGLSSAVWVAGAALLAATYTGFDLPEHFEVPLRHCVVALVVWRSTIVLCNSADIACQACLTAQSIPTDSTSVRFLLKLNKVFMSALGILFTLSNCGWNVVSIFTGFGMGSLILGLASQAILQDLIAWAVIVVQKPFVVGDFVQICDSGKGWILRIDHQTTSMRRTNGEVVTLPNKKVITCSIENYSNIPRRRWDLFFEVSALTCTETVARIPEIAREVVESQEDCEYCVCWLSEMTKFGMRFTLTYWVNKGDLVYVQNATNAIWLGLLRAFEKGEITLAAADLLKNRAAAMMEST